jgi:RNA polymerase sigma-70 factor (ECF subfamily)
MEDKIMALISIRSLYPFYKCDCVVDIPDEILKVIRDCNREEESYQRKLRYNKVRFESLNADNADEIATRIMDKPLTPYEVYAQKQMNSLLHTAISKLPSKQAKRIFAHFFLGMSYAEIARSEGVDESAVRASIERGLRNLQKNLISFL